MSSAPSPSSTPLAAPPPNWKGELRARLRDRRPHPDDLPPLAPVRPIPDAPAVITARVAERWRGAPAYGDLLAAAAADAAAEETAAQAAAQLAFNAAQASAQASLSRFADSPAGPEPSGPEHDVFSDPFFTTHRRPVEPGSSRSAPPASAEFAVEHYAPLPARPAQPALSADQAPPFADSFTEALVSPTQPLPAKLIEFPRELVATRKQRPRLAEGPLMDEHSTPDASPRIFAIEMDRGAGATIDAATQPTAPVMSDPRQPGPAREPARRRGGFFEGNATELDDTVWGSIRLGEHPEAGKSPDAAAYAAADPQAAPALEALAPLSDRLMAALVDGSIVFACLLFSVLVFASCNVHMPAGKAALAAALVAFIVQAVFYGWLFMSFGGGSTPGMRYARIALCTFSDENPTRRELQARIPATALALLPLGLGVLWALLDEDRLGWHDRMTRTYQRRYR